MLDPSRPYAIDQRDVAYLRHGDVEFLARVRRPLSEGRPLAAASRPIVVDVHGGAWCDHDRRAGKRYNEALAEAGAVVVAIDFRTGPEYQHPCGSADVAAAVRWAKASAEELGGDPARVVLTGSSSGGHLAMLAALRPNVDEHLGGELFVDGSWVNLDHVDASVGAVSPLWPPLDPRARYEYAQALDTDHGARLVANTEAYFGNIAAMSDANVTDVITSGRNTHLPAVWLVQAEYDTNVPSSIIHAFGAAYGFADGDLSVSFYSEVPHAFGHMEGAESDRFVADLIDWVRSTP